MSDNPTVPQVMNVDEVAAYLRVAPATIYRLASRGEIPAAKVGRSWRFQRKQIDQWLSEQAKGRSAASYRDAQGTDDSV